MLQRFSLWLAGILALLAVFAFLRGNVGWLLWLMIGWFVVGLVWQAARSRMAQSVDVSAARPAVRTQDRNNFDAEFCGRILRAAAILFVIALVLELIFFLTVQSAKCPGWQTVTEKQGGVVWIVWLFATIWAVHIGYRAVTWRRLSREIRDRIERAREIYVPGTNPTWMTDPAQFKAMCIANNNMNAIVVVVLIGSGVFVALPVLTRLGCF